MDRILVVAAHPDDEVLGCGGTIAKLAASGSEVFILILGEGATSRVSHGDMDTQLLTVQAKMAARTLGAKDVFFGALPDNSFDSVKLLDVIKIVESAKEQVKPTAVFTHWVQDLNIDHQITNQAVLTAFRPIYGEYCKDVFAFFTLSSSEWNYPNHFAPNIYFDISDYLDIKKNAMSSYSTEIRDWPHPRSLEGIENIAKMTGQCVGMRAAEGFLQLRGLR